MLTRSAQVDSFGALVTELAATPSETSRSLRQSLVSLTSAIEADLKQSAPLRILREDLLEAIEAHLAKFPKQADATSANPGNSPAEGKSDKGKERKPKKEKKQKKSATVQEWTGEGLTAGGFYTVMHACVATDKVQVSVAKGERVQYVAAVPPWAWVRKEDGSKGYIPGYYLDQNSAIVQ